MSPLDDFGLYISKGHNETGKLFLEIKIQKIQKFDILNRYGNWGVDRYRFPAYTHTQKSFETHGVPSQQVKVIPDSIAYFYILQCLTSRNSGLGDGRSCIRNMGNGIT